MSVDETSGLPNEKALKQVLFLLFENVIATVLDHFLIEKLYEEIAQALLAVHGLLSRTASGCCAH
ncbi:MAG: hypothetical protein AAF346_19135 [Pseudomonadota bacterium]